MSRYLHHVTLTTGHTRRSWRHEISQEAMHIVSAMLEAALAEGEAPIPAVEPACAVTITAEGRCMLATVWALDPERVPLVTIGVAPRARCGARLWALLHHHAYRYDALATRTDERPAEPWCAARLEPGIAVHEQAAHWLGDFERCLAWAWIEYLDRRS